MRRFSKPGRTKRVCGIGLVCPDMYAEKRNTTAEVREIRDMN